MAETTRRHRRRSPVQSIVDYFMDAPLEPARQLLEIVEAIVERRAPAPRKPRSVKPPTGLAPKPPVAAAPATDPPAAAPAAPAGPKAAPAPRRRRSGTKGSGTTRKRTKPAAAQVTAAGEAPAATPRRRRPAVTGDTAPPAAPAPLPEQQVPGDDNPGGNEV